MSRLATLLRRKPRSRAALLRLFSSYVGRKRIEEIDARLALTRRGGFRAPPAMLIILFASRAGSGYAGRLLANTPWFGDVGESFRPEHLDIIRARHGLADTWAAAQWMIENRGSARAFGLKGGFTQLIAATQLGLLPETIARTQFILLQRRDRLSQAVSLYRAQASGRFHSVQPEVRAVSIDDYDADKIAFNLKHIERNYRWFDTMLGQLGKTAPVFLYEDICATPQLFVREVCGLLDLPAVEHPDPVVDLEVLRDDINDAWIARFRAERPEAA